MELHHISVKIPVLHPETVDLGAFIPIFHRWIQERSRAEMAIDVADYRHVPNGPGVILVGHEADYAMEPAGGRLGLKYARKAPVQGDNAARLRQAFGAALAAAALLEREPTLRGTLKFRREEATLTLNDRLLAPRDEATYRAVEEELKRFFASTAGGVQLSRLAEHDPRERFSLAISAAAPLTLS